MEPDAAAYRQLLGAVKKVTKWLNNHARPAVRASVAAKLRKNNKGGITSCIKQYNAYYPGPSIAATATFVDRAYDGPAPL